MRQLLLTIIDDHKVNIIPTFKRKFFYTHTHTQTRTQFLFTITMFTVSLHRF